MAELRTLTERLVSTPSHDDETAAGDAVESWLREHTGADVTRDDAGNVLAWRNADADGASLALVGHHDVVPPDDGQVEGGEYRVEERDGRLYGRGAADMKGARSAIADGFAPDYAVVGEGSTGYSGDGTVDVAVAHKGRRASTVTATGRAAHASEPEAGENAVHHACDAVNVIRGLDAPEADVLGQRLAGSVAVTGIEGGSAWNVLPERCAVTVDERTVPDERAALGRVETVEGVSWSVDQDLPPMACDDTSFADAVLEAVRGVQGEAGEWGSAETPDGAGEQVAKPHATDAGWLAAAGTTWLVCGPAEPGEAHTADESVSIGALARCRGVYERVATEWPGRETA